MNLFEAHPLAVQAARDRVAAVLMDGTVFTGRIYHVRDNGWLCVETATGIQASGPEFKGDNR